MVKRKIEIKKIEDVQARNVCFSKRRQGVFNKAKELSRLCDVDVHVVVFSQAGRPFTFSSAGDASLSPALDRYLLRHSEVDRQRLVRDQELPILPEIDVSAIPDSQLYSHYNALLQLRSEVMRRLEEAAAAKNPNRHCYRSTSTDIPPVHQDAASVPSCQGFDNRELCGSHLMSEYWIQYLRYCNGAPNVQEEMPTIADDGDSVPADQLDYSIGRTTDIDEINHGQHRVAVNLSSVLNCLGLYNRELCGSHQINEWIQPVQCNDAQNQELEMPTIVENVAPFANVPADDQLDCTQRTMDDAELINHGQQFDSLWSSGNHECAEEADFHESMASLLSCSDEPVTLF